MYQKKLSAIFLSFFLLGCGCKASYMSDNYVVKEEDEILDCDEIVYAINESEFLEKSAYDRCARPHFFAKFLPCTPAVRLDAIKNQYVLSNRTNFLRSLYKLRGCEAKLKLKGQSIASQAGKIGHESVKGQEGSIKGVYYQSNKTTIAEIPANTQVFLRK